MAKPPQTKSRNTLFLKNRFTSSYINPLKVLSGTTPSEEGNLYSATTIPGSLLYEFHRGRDVSENPTAYSQISTKWANSGKYSQLGQTCVFPGLRARRRRTPHGVWLAVAIFWRIFQLGRPCSLLRAGGRNVPENLTAHSRISAKVAKFWQRFRFGRAFVLFWL